MPTNKHKICAKIKTAIIDNEISKLNRSNIGYNQRPFSKIVSVNLNTIAKMALNFLR